MSLNLEKGMSLLMRIGAVVLLVAAAGCANQARTVDVSASAEEMTHDGLYPVRGTIMDGVWARADLDVTAYNKVMLQSAGVQFRPVKSRPSVGRRSSVSEFPISEANKERFRDELTKAFLDEFAKAENFTVVTEPGPDVAILRGALIDVVSFVPEERIGRYDIYLDRVGEATLLLEFIDSQSEAVLIRAIERRAAEQTGVVMEANPVTNWMEVRRLANSWARRLRSNLELLAENFKIGEGA